MTQIESEPRVDSLKKQGSDVDEQAKKAGSSLKDCCELGDEVG